jgi:gliding motility-associated-like protein
MLRILFFAFLTTFSLQSIAQVTAVPDANGIVYVDFTKNGDGNSWNNAIKELADALRTAKTNTNIKQVWVAKGTYKPKYKPTTNNSTTDRDITFVVPNGVSLYGGFDPINDISTLADRRITGDDGTILDGQTSASNQVYHVVLFSLNTAQVIIDGFTVINGNANGPQNSSITTEGRKVYRDYGSAIYKENSSLIVRNCIIKNNKTTGFGGPLGMYGTGTARIENCTVQNNIGGMSIIDFGTTGTVINTLMSNNTTGGQSNAINAWDSSVTVVNSTIANNRGGAGPIYVEGAGVDVKIYNSIIYGNNPQRVAIATGAGIRRIYAYNSLMDVNTGLTAPTTGSIFGQNPLFVSPIAVGLGFGGDYSLQRNSIAINKGLQTDYTTNGGNLNDKDLSGLRNRVIGAIDMGAYEYGQHINSIADITKTYGDADFIVNATATSGLQVALTSSNPDIATVYQDANDNNAWKIHIVKAGTATIKANQAGNATFPPALEVTFKVTINKKPLTLAFITPFSKEYDRLTTANVTSNLKLNGVVGTDNVGHSFTTANYNNKNVGTAKAITLGNVSLTGSAASNYTLTAPALTGNITAKPLTIATSNNVVISKVYNGNNDASFTQSQFVFSGRITGDAVSFSGSATYADKSVGVGKVVTINGITLTGADALNYSLTSTSVTTSGAITRKPLTLAVSNTPLITKVYDAGTTASVPLNQFTLTGVVGGEDVSFISTSTTYNNKNAGTAKTITVAGIALDGTEAGNYSLAITSLNTTGDITAKPLTLTVSNTPTITKVYDGNDNATIPLAQYTLSGVLGNENVGFSTTDVNYDNKNVGIGKSITASGIVLNGTDAANYSLAITSLTTTGDITVKPLTLTVSNTPAITKVYDGNDNASIPLNQFTLTGKVGSEVVNFDYTDISFDDKNTGTAKDVTVNGITLNGADKDNYSLAITSLTTTGSITAKPLTLAVSSTPLITKVYDAGTTASVPLNQFTLTGVVGGEDVSFISTSTTYNNKNAGTAKTITVAGIALDGTEAGNYSLAITSLNTTGDITAKPLTLTVSNTPTITKVYDGNDNATIPLAQYTLSGVLGNENVGFSTTDVNYDNKNVGIGKSITASGIVLNGTDASNYSLAITSLTTTGDITVKPLTLRLVNTAEVVTKVYDNTTNAPITNGQMMLEGVASNDYVSFAFGSINYDNKNVGDNRTITIEGVTLGGVNAGNYMIDANKTLLGNITPKPLDIIRSTSNSTVPGKVYDGNSSATVATEMLSLVGVNGTDKVEHTKSSANYNDENAGVDKDVTVSGISLTGDDAYNYSLSKTSIIIKGEITPKPLTLIVRHTPAITKVYDGSTTASIPLEQFTLSGALTTEIVGFTYGSISYENKQVGTGKMVTVNDLSLTGPYALNYSLPSNSLNTTGDITAKPLSLIVSNTPAITKVYDGSSVAHIPLGQFMLSGGLPSENVVFTHGAIAYDDKNVGNTKNITISNIALSGADAANYILALKSLNTSGSITAKPLNVSVSSTPLITKLYDGTTTATIPTSNFNIDGVINSEDVNIAHSAINYNNKNVGNNKNVAISGIVLTGNDASNYSLVSNALTTTGNISPKPITISINANPLISKTYDGNDLANLLPANYVIDGIIGADQLSVRGTAKYSNNVKGNGKTILVNDFILDGADQLNYSISTTSTNTVGNIIGITPVIAWNNPSDIGYGKYLDVNELNASTNVSGSFAYSPNLGTLLNAGSNQTLSVTFTPSDLDGYEIVTKTILVNVLKRDLTIAVNNAERCYQTNNPSFRFDYFGFANNENESVLTNRPSISSDANHNSTAGIYRLVASGGVSNNYNFIYQNGTLTINALPVVNISASAVLINQGESATLNASGGTNYVWRDNNGTLVGSGESLVVSPTETTQYVVEVTNSSGCVSSKNISISVIKPLVIPNAFSPNGDGVHDWWEIKHIDQYPTALIQIFDISGARVYESRGYANPFDGNFKNQPLKTGVYYYVININNGNKPYTGPLTIIR